MSQQTIRIADKETLDSIKEDTAKTYDYLQTQFNFIPRYGIRIHYNESNLTDAVEYLYDAVGKAPAAMDFNAGVFDKCSWESAPFMKAENNYPCVLGSDGTEICKLNPRAYQCKDTAYYKGRLSDMEYGAKLRYITFDTNFNMNLLNGYISDETASVMTFTDENYEYTASIDVAFDVNGVSQSMSCRTTSYETINIWTRTGGWVCDGADLGKDDLMLDSSQDDLVNAITVGESSGMQVLANGENVMTYFGGGWMKFEQGENYFDVIWCERQLDPTYHAYHRVRADGSLANGFYSHTYRPTLVDGTLRSAPFKYPASNMSFPNMRYAAQMNGDGWDLRSYWQYMYITFLTVMITKSLDVKAKVGKGQCTGYSASAEEGNRLASGTLNGKGAFFGSSTQTADVKAFHVETPWGKIYEMLTAVLFKSSSQTILYQTNGDYNETGEDYTVGSQVTGGTVADDLASGVVSKVTVCDGKFAAATVIGGTDNYSAYSHYCPSSAGAGIMCPAAGGDNEYLSYSSPFSIAYMLESDSSDTAKMVGAGLSYVG